MFALDRDIQDERQRVSPLESFRTQYVDAMNLLIGIHKTMDNVVGSKIRGMPVTYCYRARSSLSGAQSLR